MSGFDLKAVSIAARRKLLANPDFTALIGTDIGKDAPGGAYTDAWLFKATDDAMTPERNPRNTGTSAIIYNLRSPWTSPNMHNTLLFRQLEFRILSDATRSADTTLVIVRDADDRCNRIANVIRDTFNDVANQDHSWPNGVYIVSSLLWTDIRINDVPDEDGLVSGEISFALELG